MTGREEKEKERERQRDTREIGKLELLVNENRTEYEKTQRISGLIWKVPKTGYRGALARKINIGALAQAPVSANSKC